MVTGENRNHLGMKIIYMVVALDVRTVTLKIEMVPDQVIIKTLKINLQDTNESYRVVFF